MSQQSNPLRGAETLAPLESLLSLLKRTEAALQAKVTQCLGSNSLDVEQLDALEAFAAQLEDRADQCASWAFPIEHMSERVSSRRAAEMRKSCAEWLRMAAE